MADASCASESGDNILFVLMNIDSDLIGNVSGMHVRYISLTFNSRDMNDVFSGGIASAVQQASESRTVEMRECSAGIYENHTVSDGRCH